MSGNLSNTDYGYFVSTGAPVIIPVRSDLDHFDLLDYTQMAIPASGEGVSNGYGYVYALTPQSVAAYTLIDTGQVLFDANGPLSGVTHTPASADIVITNAGTYEISFGVSGSEPNQFAIFVNDVPQQSTVGGSGAGTQQNNISAIVTVPAGAVINLVNYVTAGAVTLASVVGGTQPNVTAFVNINAVSPGSPIAGNIVESSWQRGFPDGSALVKEKTTVSDVISETIILANGYTLVDTSKQIFGPAIAYSGITNVIDPVVATANTSGLIANSTVVRLFNPLAYQLSGMDFTVGTLVANTSFALAYAGMAPGDAAPGAGTWEVITYDPIYYPRRRFITNIILGNTTQVQMSVTSGYNVGEKVSFIVPKVYGTIEMNGLRGTILSIDLSTNTITLDINSSGFTAFTFPRASSVPFTQAQVIPQGEIPTLSNSATQNKAVLGILVGTAVCGTIGRVMYWRATKAFRYSTSLNTQ